MPKWTRIKLFNTGVGLTAGEPDPHWQIVARTDDPHFKPQQAVKPAFISQWWLANDSRSQWISLAAECWSPVGVTYKFRTTFELVGLQPRTAALRGLMAADDFVRAIYLNGRKVFSPREDEKGYGFVAMRPFSVTDGFVEGANVLEFDVRKLSYNDGAGARRAESDGPSRRVGMFCHCHAAYRWGGSSTATPTVKRRAARAL